MYGECGRSRSEGMDMGRGVKKWKLWARLLDEEGDWSFRITLVPHVGYRDECGCSSSNGIIVPVGPEMWSDAEFCSC